MTSGFIRARALGAAAAWCLAVACVSRPPELAVLPAPARDFPVALAEAQIAVASGRYADAERRLAAFSTAFEGTTEAAEADYWRALLRLDPANRDASARDAIALLDTYLKAPAVAHRVEATTLRRVAAQRESLARELDAARDAAAKAAAVVPTPAVAPKPDEEIQRLRDSLTRTTAELDRIKRRLAAPRP